MTWLPPVLVAVPLGAAGILIAVLTRIGRRGAEAVALVASVATLAGCCALLRSVAASGATTLWLGGWHPGNTVGLGIAFAVDLASASVATVVALVVTAAVVFSREYFDEVGTIFYVLLLAMLGAMTAFAFAADAFDLFVFYEVFSVAAYALAAYRIEKEGAFEGALQFALTNTLAGLFILFGIILLEARTGELNLAAIGHALAEQRATTALVPISFAFVSIGLFTRGALVPLHWWFDEVHANAPTPLCVVLSGAMVPIAIYGFVRFYWTAYASVLAPDQVRVFVIAVGLVSAIVGSAMCLRERNLKRALAFSTIAHGGVALATIGAFESNALAAAAWYLVTYAACSSGLFMAIAILRKHAGDVRWPYLIGCGRALPLTGTIFAVAVCGIAGFWPSSHAVFSHDAGWPATVAGLVVAVATGSAFARIYIVVFLGRSERKELPTGDIPWFMVAPAALLVAVPAALSIGGSARAVAASAAASLLESSFRHAPAGPQTWPVLASVVGIAVVTAALLSRAAAVRNLRGLVARNAALRSLAACHDGDVGRYVTWIVGTAIFASAACSWIR